MSKVVEMTEKKCVSRPALWALGLASALAMAANGAFAAGNRMAAEVAAAADAPAPSGVGDSGGAKTWDFDHDR
ncbi:MAG: hypothetical protein ACXWNE_10415, partial [Candidatus Binataceae bacterium]